jgi:hypothetical protein
MKVANIVSTNKINVSDEFNVVSSMNDIIHDLPTLIVGIETVVKHYPDFNILDICLEPNVYWTFKRTEKRDKFQEDLDWFIRKVYNDLMGDIVYIFVDPIQHKPRTLIKIVRKIASIKDLVTYVHGDMIYIYGERMIFGVDLKLLRYMHVNIDKIKNKIKDKSLVFLDDKKILIEYKKNVETLGNKVRYIPYLFTIRNGQNDTSSLIHIPREG